MRNVIVSYKNLPLEVKKALRDEYPLGVEYELQSIKNVMTGGYFEGVIYTFNDVLYLIKMGVDTPTMSLDADSDDIGDEPLLEGEDSFNDEY